MASPKSHSDHNQLDSNHCDGTDAQSQQPPAAPKPEDDAGMISTIKPPEAEDEDLSPENIDIFKLKPVSALKLLCHSIDRLVLLTGDVPPTPPVRTPTKSRSPVRASFSADGHDTACAPRHDVMNRNLHVPGSDQQTFAHEGIDSVPFRRATIGSPESIPWDMNSPPQEDVGYNAQPLYIQHATLARKFYSKRPPPISTEDYLLRMHKYCPMSTAVYLATSHFITRLAVHERAVPVTPRNVHRLLLAGLRVSMKALEDLSWPHSRFAKVGGVSEIELGRLEITFCFLTSFMLKINAEQLQDEAEILAKAFRDVDLALLDSPGESKKFELRLPDERFKPNSSLAATRPPEKRKASSALPSRPALHVGAGMASGIEVMGRS